MKGREEGCNQKGGTEQTDQDGKIKQNGKKKLKSNLSTIGPTSLSINGVGSDR